MLVKNEGKCQDWRVPPLLSIDDASPLTVSRFTEPGSHVFEQTFVSSESECALPTLGPRFSPPSLRQPPSWADTRGGVRRRVGFFSFGRTSFSFFLSSLLAFSRIQFTRSTARAHDRHQGRYLHTLGRCSSSGKVPRRRAPGVPSRGRRGRRLPRKTPLPRRRAVRPPPPPPPHRQELPIKQIFTMQRRRTSQSPRQPLLS